jgi:hypothetical protein
MTGTRPPFQGDSSAGHLPRAKAHGLFCFRPSGEVPWTGRAQKSRPVGYGVIRPGARTDSMIEKQETVHYIEQQLERSNIIGHESFKKSI